MQAQWDSLQLPCRPDIAGLQAWQGKIYATATGGAVFESADNGANWHFAFDHPNFVINPANGAFYSYFTQSDGSMYLSCAPTHWNNGFSTSYLPDAKAYFLSGFAFSNDTAYFFNGYQLARLNGSQIAEPVPMPADFYLVQCRVYGPNFWIANGGLLLHSPDYGANWDTVFTDTQNRLSLAAAGDTLLVDYFDEQQQAQLLARTTNQGQSWESTAGHPNLLTISGGRPFLGKSSDGNTAWFSWNGLTDWQHLNTEFLPRALLVSNGVKIAGQPFGVQVESGGQWTTPPLGAGIPGEMTYSLIFLRKANDILLFGGDDYGYGLFERPEGSAGWTPDPKPYFPERSVQTGNHLIGCGRYGTYRAQLGGPGFDWEWRNAKTGYLFETNGKAYLADRQTGAIFRTDDEGLGWTPTGTTPNTYFRNSFAASGGNFFQLQGANLMISENEGQSWTVRHTFPLVFDIPDGSAKLVTHAGLLFMAYGQSQQLFVSADNGLSFSSLPIPQNPNLTGFRLRVFGNQLYFNNGDGNLYRSDNLGQSWKTVKPPYPDFNFDYSMANSSMTADDSHLYLFDPSRGAAWVAKLADLEPSPCDAVFIDLPPVICYFPDIYIEMSQGMVATWFEDAVQIQQGGNYFPQFPMKNGSTYKLVISDPGSGCSVSAETVIDLPVADVGFSPVMSCDEEFQTLDLSGCTKGPGIRHSIYGYTADQFYYSYANQFDASGQPSNPNPPVVRPGFYVLQVYDSQLDCITFDTAYIQHEVENPIADFQTTLATCGQNDGTASVLFSSDPALTTVEWSTGANGATIAGLAPGWYSVTVSEGFCTEHRNFEIEEDPACKVKIRGKIQYDPNNADCIADNASFNASTIQLHLLPDDIYTFADKFGDYEFIRPPGDYTVEFVNNLHFQVHCPGPNGHSVSLPNFGAVSEGNDFFIQKKPAPNIGITVTPGTAIRGETLTVKLELCNFSNQNIFDATMALRYDSLLPGPAPTGFFQSFDPVTHTAVSNQIYMPVYPTCLTYDIHFPVPPTIPLGEVLHFSIDLQPVAGDIFPADNHVEWAQTVVGSYDPNDKQVSPGDTEFGGAIFEKDSVLRYTIRFQNTGNHPARTVEIRDTLDASLDVTTIQPGSTSHYSWLQWRFEGENVLVMRFENINLPDSSQDVGMSQGFVTFSIKRKPGLPQGTVIRNRAAIYFDYNAPVITNTVASVLSGPVGVRPEQAGPFSILLFPNPATGVFTVRLPAPAAQGLRFRIADLTGRILLETKAETDAVQQSINAGSLPDGLYFLQLVSEGKLLAVERFVKH